MKSSVYDRTGGDTMSRGNFYATIGAVLTWGFAATAYVADRTADWQPGLGMMLLVGLALPLLGIFMSVSTSALVSFLGFNLVAIPFGAVLGPVLAHYEMTQPGLVSNACMVTAGVSGAMAVSGMLFPNFYSKIGGALFMALICLVVVRLIGLFVPGFGDLTIIHYLAAGLFALYIGFDMWRASQIPATLDNAVDVSISLYLDIINLFLEILRIMSKK
jgi:FtsH-binding integral membrane protein